VGLGFQERGAGEDFLQRFGFDTPEDPLAGMEMNGEDFLVASNVPLFAEIFDFGQFRHVRGNVMDIGKKGKDLRA
jgi:hypothetical protein